MQGRGTGEAKSGAFSLAALYDTYGARLYGYALAMLGNPTEAEDVVQEVFVKLAARRSEGLRIKDPEAYLLRAARNQAYSRLRRGRSWFTRKDRYAAYQLLAQEEAGAHPEREREQLDAALARLPAKQREVIVLKHFRDMTFEAIGKLTRVSPNTAANAISAVKAHP